MGNAKTRIEQNIIALQISDLLKNKDGIIFDSSLCTQDRVLRFQTPTLLEVLPNTKSKGGAWNNGRYIMYEIYNMEHDFKITCSLGHNRIKNKLDYYNKLINDFGATKYKDNDLYFLKTWTFTTVKNVSKTISAVEKFLDVSLPEFEEELTKWISKNASIVAPDSLLEEGGAYDIITNKYERNIKARNKCIEVHGSKCNICGFDFAALYGPEFAGKIHVHHKVPLSEIKKNYIVDPVNDLIPVCPNCHMILHSKIDGTYTVEEVKDMIKNRGRETQ